MAQTRIDVPALYAALDGARKTKDLSWRQVAAQVGCSPSTMTRLANGYRPDADAFMSLVHWLRMPAERFWTADTDDDRKEEQPELMSELGVLLRARRDIDEHERGHLEDVLRAALKLNVNRRAGENR